MLNIEKYITASPEQWKIIIEGMRNPLNSWEKSDSHTVPSYEEQPHSFAIGHNDHNLMMNLSSAGSDHAKFRRMIPVYITLVAPLYWWKEFDTYKVGTVANSCSTMHTIHAKEFVRDDFSQENLTETWISEDGVQHNSIDYLDATIEALNVFRRAYLRATEPSQKKRYWNQIIQLLPSSYNQRRTVFVNYETLANIYPSRRHHKLAEWHTFCDFIKTLPYAELIIGEVSKS